MPLGLAKHIKARMGFTRLDWDHPYKSFKNTLLEISAILQSILHGRQLTDKMRVKMIQRDIEDGYRKIAEMMKSLPDVSDNGQELPGRGHDVLEAGVEKFLNKKDAGKYRPARRQSVEKTKAWKKYLRRTTTN